MTQSSGTITSIFKSRQTLLHLLREQKYDTKDYEEFSINEVHVMYNNKQLDMLMSSDETLTPSKKKGICQIPFSKNITQAKYKRLY
jgi:hypothetical protein